MYRHRVRDIVFFICSITFKNNDSRLSCMIHSHGVMSCTKDRSTILKTQQVFCITGLTFVFVNPLSELVICIPTWKIPFTYFCIRTGRKRVEGGGGGEGRKGTTRAVRINLEKKKMEALENRLRRPWGATPIKFGNHWCRQRYWPPMNIGWFPFLYSQANIFFHRWYLSNFSFILIFDVTEKREQETRMWKRYKEVIERTTF